MSLFSWPAVTCSTFLPPVPPRFITTCITSFMSTTSHEYSLTCVSLYHVLTYSLTIGRATVTGHTRGFMLSGAYEFTAQQRAVLRHLTFNRHVFRSEEHYRPRCIAIRSPSEVIGWGNVTLSMTLKQLTASSITRTANVHVPYRCRVFLEPKQQIFLQCFNSLRIHISFSAEIPEVKLAAVFPQPARTANTWCIEPGRVIDEVVNGNDQTNTIFNYTSTFSCWIMIHLNKGIWKKYVKQQWFESEFSIFFLPFKSLNSSRKD